jgi:hypothetical protein
MQEGDSNQPRGDPHGSTDDAGTGGDDGPGTNTGTPRGTPGKGTPGANYSSGEEPYSPSQATGTPRKPPEAMEWDSNLDGIKQLYSNPLGDQDVNQIAIKPAPPPQSQPPSPPPATAPPTTAPAVAGAPPHHQDRTIPDVSSMVNRAADYLKKKKEEKITAVKNRLGTNLLAYEAIQRSNSKRMECINLLTGAISAPPCLGTMLSEGDGRLLSSDLRMLTKNKQILSSSVDLGTGRCLGCKEHGRDASTATLKGIQTFFLTDQSYPPVLPSSTTRGCVKILRLETGRLEDLAEEFLRIHAVGLEAGSLILMFSASQLAACGTAAYAEDLVAARNKILARAGVEVRVGPLPPFFLGGCTDEATIRAAVEVTRWSQEVWGEEEFFLENGHKAALRAMKEMGKGSQAPAPRMRIRLPGKKNTLQGKSIWEIGGEAGFPSKVMPANDRTETQLMKTIIAEIRSRMALDLDPSPTFERGLGRQVTIGRKVHYLVCGSSNAERLARGLEAAGNMAAAVDIPNWRINDQSVEQMRIMLKEAILKHNPDTIVFQLLDNSIYFAKMSDGGTIPSRKGLDGKYHVDGELVLASRETQQQLLKTCRPLFEVAAGRKAVIVAPLPRYITAGCCNDEDHVSNRRNPSFKADLLEALELHKRVIKDFLYLAHLRNIKVVDPVVDLRGMPDEEVWGTDPVHPREEVYRQLAAGIMVIALTMTIRKPADQQRELPDAKRPRQGSLHEQPRGGFGGGGGPARRPNGGQDGHGGDTYGGSTSYERGGYFHRPRGRGFRGYRSRGGRRY